MVFFCLFGKLSGQVDNTHTHIDNNFDNFAFSKLSASIFYAFKHIWLFFPLSLSICALLSFRILTTDDFVVFLSFFCRSYANQTAIILRSVFSACVLILSVGVCCFCCESFISLPVNTDRWFLLDSSSSFSGHFFRTAGPLLYNTSRLGILFVCVSCTVVFTLCHLSFVCTNRHTTPAFVYARPNRMAFQRRP